MSQRLAPFDFAAIAICALAWGTTWFAITLQFGVVDPIVSIVYRFGLSAALIFGWCLVRREPIALNAAQHRAAFGVGLFTFALDYAFVYWAEERVISAVVAVVFASMAFVNLATFRFAFGQRAPAMAWVAASLGVLGVAVLSWSELLATDLNTRAIVGLALTFLGVLAAAIGNVFARKGEEAGASILASTGWAMAYGTGLLALFALVTDRAWAFEPTLRYIGSLLYLSVFGSVIAFLLYYALARRRGYTTASYISALLPPVAMTVSSVFEAKTWGPMALGGVVLVLAGQVLLLRTKRA